MPAELTLFPHPGQIVKAVTKELAKEQVHNAALTNAGVRNTADAYWQIAARVKSVANSDLVAPFIAGWRLHNRLTAAARESLEPPYPTKTVVLKSYGFRHAQPYEIDVYVDGHYCTTVSAGLTLDVTFVQFKGTVRGGYLVAVDAGDTGVSAALTLDGTVILKGRRSLELKAAVRLEPPVPLL